MPKAPVQNASAQGGGGYGIGLPWLSLEMTVRLMYRLMVYHMVLGYRRGVVASAVVAHDMMVTVAGAQGYETDDGEADFYELVHCFGVFFVG